MELNEMVEAKANELYKIFLGSNLGLINDNEEDGFTMLAKHVIAGELRCRIEGLRTGFSIHHDEQGVSEWHKTIQELEQQIKELTDENKP